MAALVAPLGCEAIASRFETAPEQPSVSASGSASVVASTSARAAPAPPRADPGRLALRGRTVQGGLMFGTVEPDTRKVRFPGHRLVVGKSGAFLVAFHRNAPKRETLTITFPDGAVLDKHFDVEQRDYQTERIDGLPDRFVNLDLATRKKLRDTNKRIDALRMRYSDKPYYEDGFVWPLTGRITSRYGYKRILNGKDSGLHWGVDIAVPVGAKVHAPSSGKVVFAERDVPLAGHTVIIDHGHGLSSTLIHLQTFHTKVGAVVKRGDLVATVGMTGRTTGSHLDWRMNFFETRIDPELLVGPMEAAAP
jgi:murein DD-endopeptidase MepM/ murein hydrolase activator NlpD